LQRTWLQKCDDFYYCRTITLAHVFQVCFVANLVDGRTQSAIVLLTFCDIIPVFAWCSYFWLSFNQPNFLEQRLQWGMGQMGQRLDGSHGSWHGSVTCLWPIDMRQNTLCKNQIAILYLQLHYEVVSPCDQTSRGHTCPPSLAVPHRSVTRLPSRPEFEAVSWPLSE